MFVETLSKALPVAAVSTTIALFGAEWITPSAVQAATLYYNITNFESQLDRQIVDDYERDGYLAGDTFDGTHLDIHTDTSMSNILSETKYETTRFKHHNLIVSRGAGHRYCAGCNGSFGLDFTQTSIGNTLGIFGASFEVFASPDYLARVTFGDGSQESFSFASTTSNFWGITSEKRIQRIFFSTNDALPQSNHSFVEIDNLTIGSAAIARPVGDSATLQTEGDGSADLTVRDRITLAGMGTVPTLESDTENNLEGSVPSDRAIANPTSVPEPTSLLGLFLLGSLGLGSKLKRKRK